jgi:hypothetical protein
MLVLKFPGRTGPRALSGPYVDECVSEGVITLLIQIALVSIPAARSYRLGLGVLVSNRQIVPPSLAWMVVLFRKLRRNK